MVRSGAKPNQAAIEGFQRVMKGDNRWAIFKFDWSKGKTHPQSGKKLDQDIVTVAEIGSSSASFNDLLDKLALDQCLYIAYDCRYSLPLDLVVQKKEDQEQKKEDQDEKKDEQEEEKPAQLRHKVLLVAWANDECHGPAAIKMKMLLTSTETEIVQKFTGYAKKCTLNSVDDLTEDNFVDIVSENRTK
jgi:hypothetical protein